jgi:hypothetical protein
MASGEITLSLLKDSKSCFFLFPLLPHPASLVIMSPEGSSAHVRMDTSATMVAGDWSNEPIIAHPLSKEKEAHFDGVVTDAIPRNHPDRTLVVCFDGTGDQ